MRVAPATERAGDDACTWRREVCAYQGLRTQSRRRPWQRAKQKKAPGSSLSLCLCCRCLHLRQARCSVCPAPCNVVHVVTSPTAQVRACQRLCIPYASPQRGASSWKLLFRRTGPGSPMLTRSQRYCNSHPPIPGLNPPWLRVPLFAPPALEVPPPIVSKNPSAPQGTGRVFVPSCLWCLPCQACACACAGACLCLCLPNPCHCP